MELKICYLYPDVLSLYGDRGNILCMKKRLEWRGIGASVFELPIGENRALSAFDIFFIGGGQDMEQQLLLDDLYRGKGAQIKSAVLDGKTFLAICGGYQILGHSYRTWDGKQIDYIGAVDYETVGARQRMVGNFSFQCFDISGESEVIGYENHSGRTFLGSDILPLGKVISGNGNNGKDGTEGVRYNNVFGTYCHGPVLPKNPEFCDFILQTALKEKYGTAFLEPLPDREEQAAHFAARKLLKNN